MKGLDRIFTLRIFKKFADTRALGFFVCITLSMGIVGNAFNTNAGGHLLNCVQEVTHQAIGTHQYDLAWSERLQEPLRMT